MSIYVHFLVSVYHLSLHLSICPSISIYHLSFGLSVNSKTIYLSTIYLSVGLSVCEFKDHVLHLGMSAYILFLVVLYLYFGVRIQ